METAAKNGHRRWWALTALCLAVFMSLLDSTIVNVALPTIQTELRESYSDLQWIINAYTLAFAMCLLLASKFGDLFGRKKVFMISLSIFTLGSLASALSQTPMQLNWSRMIQGIGGAGMMSLSMTIVAETFDDRERGIAFGVWSSVVGVATALGPVLGGFLIRFFDWRAIFFINLPIGLIALFMSFKFVDETLGIKNEKIDWLGMIFSTAMIFCFVFGLVQKEVHPAWKWSNQNVWLYFVLGAILLILFLITEKLFSETMIDLTLFKSWSFNGTALASFCLGAGLYAYLTYLTIWMQNYLNYTAEQTGIRQLAIGLMSLIIGPIAGILSNRFAKRWLIAGGLLLIACGLFEIEQVVSMSVTYPDFVIGFIILGIGNAIVNPPLSSAAVESVENKFVGIASGVVNVFRQLGSTFGIVILGMVLNNHYQASIGKQIDNLSVPESARNAITKNFQEAGPVSSHDTLKVVQHYFDQLINGNLLMEDIRRDIFIAFNQGYKTVLLVSIMIVLIGAIIAILTIRDKTKQTNISEE